MASFADIQYCWHSGSEKVQIYADVIHRYPLFWTWGHLYKEMKIIWLTSSSVSTKYFQKLIFRKLKLNFDGTKWPSRFQLIILQIKSSKVRNCTTYWSLAVSYEKFFCSFCKKYILLLYYYLQIWSLINQVSQGMHIGLKFFLRDHCFFCKHVSIESKLI